MSAPPPYSTPRPTENPDRRPLPPGWITQFDRNYQAWYYVDTTNSPTQSQWNHPLDPPMSSPPQSQNYQSSASRASYSSSFPQQQVQPFGGQAFNQPSQPAAFSGSPQEQRAYPTQQQYQAQPNVAYGTPNQYRNTGWAPNWQQQQQPQQGYIPQPVTQVPQQQPQRGHGRGAGMGTALLAGGGGLVAGALLTEAFEHHERREEDQAYDQGYMDGQDNDFGGGGGDFDGGNW